MAGATTLPSYNSPLPVSEAQSQQNASNAARTELSRNEFMQLMIAELQHQDPLEPMSNTELLGQMTQMETLNASAQTADGINNLIGALKFQQLTIATAYIGTVVKAEDGAGQEIQGLVGRVMTNNGNVSLGLQVPVVDGSGAFVRDAEGNIVTREVPVALDSVQEVVAPGLAGDSSTIQG
ncbi:MAG: hypothetical protein IT462_06115 [Planctomycetes bacterium]|nr:hypothetical protein [Planctomycetota bacterium]